MDIQQHLRHLATQASWHAGEGQGLDVDGARDLMSAILEGRWTPAQLGALAMAMSVRGETSDELTGFVQAAQARCMVVPSDEPVVLIPSYRGSRNRPNLTPLLAMWLARQGVRVLMHGPLVDPRRITSAEVLQDLGVAPARLPAEALRAWQRREPAFVPAHRMCPPLQALLDVQAELGTANPGRRVAALVNPVLGAPVLRLLCEGRAERRATLHDWFAHESVDALVLGSVSGEPVVDPLRPSRLQVWLQGRPQSAATASTEAQHAGDWPLLPPADDAAHLALHAQEVLSGMRPVPSRIADQAKLIVHLVATMRSRDTPSRVWTPAVSNL